MYSWDNAQVVLVGNKCDLEQDRAVTQERGKRLADQMGKFCLLNIVLWMYAYFVLGFLLLLYLFIYIYVVMCVMFFKGFYR
jgi:GTPase SAR1 family protein